METSLTHPRKEAARTRFFPYTVTIKGLDASGQTAVIATLKCAYQPDTGASPADFENEAPVGDKILIPSWQPGIEAKQLAVLERGSWSRRFEISDVLPTGSGPDETLLVVTPA